MRLVLPQENIENVVLRGKAEFASIESNQVYCVKMDELR